MELDIKICGLSTPEALDAALERGASHVGFVHFAPSPRHLDLAPMAALAERARGRAAIVAVLVDPTDETLRDLAETVGPDIVQLHGSETPARVAEIRGQGLVPVMKAISIGSAEDVAGVSAYRAVADRLLLDAKRPKGAVLPGGNGVAFDWRLLAALDPSVRYMLSGGLGPENVEAALELVRPAGIDVSSGVESAPGVKDLGRLHLFFDALDRVGATGRPSRDASDETALLNRKLS